MKIFLIYFLMKRRVKSVNKNSTFRNVKKVVGIFHAWQSTYVVVALLPREICSNFIDAVEPSWKQWEQTLIFKASFFLYSYFIRFALFLLRTPVRLKHAQLVSALMMFQNVCYNIKCDLLKLYGFHLLSIGRRNLTSI